MLLVATSALVASRVLQWQHNPPKPIQMMQGNGKARSLPSKWEEKTVPLGKSGSVIAFGSNGLQAIAGLGTIMVSRDNGATWQALNGGPGQISVTKDGGVTYEAQSKPLIKTNDLCGVESAAINKSGRLFLKTTCEHTAQLWSVPLTDTSAEWHVVVFTYQDDPANGVYGPSSDFVMTGDRVLIEGSLRLSAAILTTDDEGKSWRPFWRSSFFGAGLATFDFVDETGWILLGDGQLLVSEDRGKSWERVSSIPDDVAQSAYSMKFASREKGFIVGKNGLVLVTENGGRKWQQSRSNVTFNLHKVASANGERAWAVGNSSSVLETDDGGMTWRTVDLGINQTIYHRLSVNNGVAWVCADNSLFHSR